MRAEAEGWSSESALRSLFPPLQARSSYTPYPHQMDELPPSSVRVEDDAPGSPKRKKVRAKYAPKACVSCRRSKLKCSGENPCQRCLDNGRRCFYSEDQTAAEALQNLSRPTPAQPPPPTNGNGFSRRNILPRNEGIERRASDASVLGISMEARMTRIETMMEALIQERGTGMTPRGSLERDEGLGDVFQGETPVQPSLEPFTPNVASTRPHRDLSQETPYIEPRLGRSISMASPAGNTDLMSCIRVGSRVRTFPNTIEYQKYLTCFFSDINQYHPCINEVDFRMRGDSLLATRVVHSPNEGLFLALNYLVFACIDIATNTGSPHIDGMAYGWRWYQEADEIVGKRKISGKGDLTMVQFLIYEALYLTLTDRPNAAYNVIGLACRLSFQLSLHQQLSWRYCTPFDIHMRQRIFWTLYFMERRIALSCGRPYSIRESDIDVEQPSWIYDRNLHPDQSLPELDEVRSSNIYLSCMSSWAKFAGDVWDQVLAASATRRGVDGENATVLDARIKHWTEITLPSSIPLIPRNQPPDIEHLKQRLQVYTRFDLLRLLLRRRTMLSLKYDSSIGRLCGDLAVNIIERIRSFISETRLVGAIRLDIAASLGMAVLILSALLVRDLQSIGLYSLQPIYAEGFQVGISILHDLTATSHFARRVADDLKDVIQAVSSSINPPYRSLPANVENMFPYRELDFAQQPGLRDDQVGEANAWNGADAAEAWDLEPQPPAGTYGVPWI
ncbi:hypothetical protein CC78DRAFT_587376 [Lojkania enalia]|uniref:Zn(2)-C6 fungal-type domain-containing protein n=1 Tax=Lojkania enalia TaxID=147567 RepID=A0A9P4K2C8_9PLEO|nr:hypothetical protein CC78DRAFT_587376 [Didymosphaeria enalia]